MMLEGLVIIGSVVVGLIIGSFLNVCICRIPKDEGIDYPPSHCPECDHRLSGRDLIPVVSYCLLGGRCRYCGEKISIRYPLVEIVNAVAYGFVAWWAGWSVVLLLGWGFVSVVIVLTLIDWEHMILPTKVIVFGSIWAILLQGVRSILYRDVWVLIESLLGGLVGYGIIAAAFWLALRLMKKEGMGYGDVRYLGMLGLFTSADKVLLIVIIACIVGSIYGIGLAIKQKESNYFPFGPFLSLGGIVAFFYGDAIIGWYMQWSMGVIGGMMGL